MKLFRLLIWILGPLFCIACDKNDYSGIDLTDFRQDIVSCLHDNETLIFLRDDGTILYPLQTFSTGLIPERQRVLIGYSPTEQIDENKTKITLQTAITLIPYSQVAEKTKDEADELPDDPLYLTSVWYGGECINLRYQIEYHHAAHTMAMIAVEPQVSTDTLDLQLRYNNGNDAPGYYRTGYASFRIGEPLPENIRVRINTSNLGGEKYFVFTTNQ